MKTCIKVFGGVWYIWDNPPPTARTKDICQLYTAYVLPSL